MNNDSLVTLCLTRGGSHAYGLAVPTSDVDLRGVFVNTSVAHLVGLSKDEILVKQDEQEDSVMTEFRHALRLLRGANTQMIELLFQTTFESIHPLWAKVVGYRKELIDSKKLFNALMGYMQGELRLANGERTGKLGGKRKEAIDRFGFSPKNFVQLLRLAKAGCAYFKQGVFPVNMMEYDSDFGKYLLDIKVNPEKYTKLFLNTEAANMERELKNSYDNRSNDTIFNEQIANELCLQVYAPFIADHAKT